MENRSRSTLFLMEQMIVIVVFAFCAAVCVKLIAEAHVITTRNNDIKNSIIVAESGAECYKAFAGDAAKIAATLGGIYIGTNDNAEITVYYDEDWRSCKAEQSSYIMAFKSSIKNSLLTGNISIHRKDGDELLSITVSVRGDGYE